MPPMGFVNLSYPLLKPHTELAVVACSTTVVVEDRVTVGRKERLSYDAFDLS